MWYDPYGTHDQAERQSGGLTVRLDLLRQNLILSAAVALFGVLTPIALSFGLLYAGFHYG
jgi:hypothetical protein